MSEVSGEALDTAIRERVQAVRERIAAAASRAGRSEAEIRLVGVSKRQSAARVAAAVRAGVCEIGENFPQEARDKRAEVAALLGAQSPRLHWRMIGRLQRNKAKLAVDIFDAVESVDRLELARALDQRAAAAGRALDVMLQVNISNEPQKGGVSPDEVEALLDACRELEHLRLTGLMAVPAWSPDPEASRAAFARLRKLRDTLGERRGEAAPAELSMGMSGDFEVAIEEGATRVRVGTAIFGPRPTDPERTE